MATSKPKLVDLFCGAGGMTLGLVEAGYESVQAYDNWPAAVATFRRNLGPHAGQFDLAESPKISRCDIIVGGPPCQGFSSAGRRHADDDRNSLVRAFASIIAEHEPKAFIFENVEGFLTTGRGAYVRDLLEPLLAAGYLIHLRKVNAANFGVPQHRKRVIAIGGLGFDPGFPAWTHRAFGAPGAHLAASGYPSAQTLGDAISDLPAATTEPPGPIPDHWYRPLSGEDLERALLLGPGQTMRDLPEELWHESYRRRSLRRVMDGIAVEKRGGAPAGVRRLRNDEPCKAITGGSLRDFIHPTEHRPITIREAARIQTYPDWFEFEGNQADRIQMIGNSVPVKLANAIGSHLIKRLPCSDIRATGTGELLSFVPTLSTGMSPALAETCRLVESEFGVRLQEEPLLWA
jgi:DNA (cytosine-5)-methyltransferase 1